MRQTGLLFVVALLFVMAGCLGGPPSVRPANGSTNGTPTASPTATSVPVTSLPGPDCLADSAPRPDATDGVDPRPYPDPPATVNRTTVGRYAAAVERVYLHNHLLAREDPDDDQTLAEISVAARATNVTRVRTGYVVVLSESAGTNYESGLHGDYWPSVAYRVDGQTLVRGTVEDDEPTFADATVVLECR